MLDVLRTSWALFLGILLIGVGGGLLSTLIAVRGTIEGFSPFGIGTLMTGHFMGYIFGAIVVPKWILQVGHVRAFAALASVSSLVFIIYPSFPNLPVWFILEFSFGFCLSGFLFVAARRLNKIASVKTSGRIIFIYLIMQTLGLILGQVVLNFASAEGFELFIIGSVILSLSLIPMILTNTITGLNTDKDRETMKLIEITPMGAVAAFVHGKTFDVTKTMEMKDLIKDAPLGTVGMFLQGGLIIVMYTMAAIFGLQKGLSIVNLSIFISAVYIGGAITQHPMGWLADRMDRRWLIVIIASLGAVVCVYGTFIGNDIILLASVGIMFAGAINPIYSLYMADTNDILGGDTMEAASGLLSLINAIGGMIGTILVGAVITIYGANAYFIYIASLMGLIAVFTLYHIIRGRGADVPLKEL